MGVCKHCSILLWSPGFYPYSIHHLEKLKFIAKLSNCDNGAVSTSYKLFSHSNELKTLNWMYDVSQDYSINSAKGSIYKHFKAICKFPN